MSTRRIRGSRPLTRRLFLHASASALAVGCNSSAGTEPGAGTSGDSEGSGAADTDVVVIGAGLAGLRAARELAAAGFEVKVLEGRARVGGRTEDIDIGNGHVVEAGAQWVGPAQTRILALADELGVTTFASHESGDTVLHFEGLRWEQATPAGRSALDALATPLEQLAATVPFEAPWNAPDADALDNTSVREWLEAQTASDEALLEFELFLATTLSAAAEDVSMLYLAFYVASAGSVEALSTDAQAMRFAGGPEQLCQRMAEALGDGVMLEATVERVEDLGDRVTIHSAAGLFHARRVIVAMMPADARRITFAPSLPPQREKLHDAWGTGGGIKVHAVYDRPFWRERGLSGAALSDLPVAGVTFDASPEDGSRGVLLVFPNDEALPEDPANWESAVLADLAALFGPEAAEPRAFLAKDWHQDPMTAGCVSPLPPGLLTRAGSALREPAGRVHWAGTETAQVWTGYMEGAVRSGERVAREVAAALTGQ